MRITQLVVTLTTAAVLGTATSAGAQPVRGYFCGPGPSHDCYVITPGPNGETAYAARDPLTEQSYFPGFVRDIADPGTDMGSYRSELLQPGAQSHFYPYGNQYGRIPRDLPRKQGSACIVYAQIGAYMDLPPTSKVMWSLIMTRSTREDPHPSFHIAKIQWLRLPLSEGDCNPEGIVELSDEWKGRLKEFERNMHLTGLDSAESEEFTPFSWMRGCRKGTMGGGDEPNPHIVDETLEPIYDDQGDVIGAGYTAVTHAECEESGSQPESSGQADAIVDGVQGEALE